VADELKPLFQQRLEKGAQLPPKLNAVRDLRENVIALRSNPVRDGSDLHIKQAVRLTNHLNDRNTDGTKSARLEACS
jgi:hypothetical protein